MAKLELNKVLEENPASSNPVNSDKDSKPVKKVRAKYTKKKTAADVDDMGAFWDSIERNTVKDDEVIKRLNIDVPSSFNDEIKEVAASVGLNKSQLILKILHNAVDSYKARKAAENNKAIKDHADH